MSSDIMARAAANAALKAKQDAEALIPAAADLIREQVADDADRAETAAATAQDTITDALGGITVAGTAVGYRMAFVQNDAAGNPYVVWGVKNDGSVWPSGGTVPAYAAASGYAVGNNQLNRYVAGMDTGKVAVMIIGLGQSNMDGENNDAGDALLATTPKYPGKALMLEGGPRVRTATGDATLVDLVETQAGGGSSIQKDTPMSGIVNHLIRDFNAALGFEPTVVGVVAARGGQPYLNLQRGTTAYGQMLSGAKLAMQALRARGFTTVIPIRVYIGSETDTTNTPNITITRQMVQMIQFERDTAEDLQRILGNQGIPPLFVAAPANVYTGRSAWTNGPVREAMRKLDRRGNIVSLPATYAYPQSDHIHRSNLGRNQHGQRIAAAIMDEVFGGSYHGIKPVADETASGWLDATKCFVDFDATTAPTIDTSGDQVSTADFSNINSIYGLVFADDSTTGTPTITDAHFNGFRLVVTLSAKPNGPRPRLGYALLRTITDTGDAHYTWDGADYGARGLIRDTAGSVNLYDSSTQYDWCPSFIIPLPPKA